MISQAPTSIDRPARGNPALEASLAAWRSAGLIGADQADAIRAFEHAATIGRSASSAPATPRRRIPVVAEALGYLGGMLGVIGLVLLTARSWDDIGTTGRLLVTGGAMVALTVAGMMVPHRGEPALERLRGFVWAGATASGALAGGVFAKDVLDADWVPSMVLGAAVVATTLSLVLWWQHDRPVQQTTFLVGALVTMGTATAEFADPAVAGLMVWALGGIILAAGLMRRTTAPALTVAVGAAGAVVGAMITITDDQGSGLLFSLLTTGALVALAGSAHPVLSSADRVVLTVVGAMGTVQTLPQTIVWFGEEAGLLTGAVVFTTGVVLLLLAGKPIVATPLVAQLAGGALLVAGAAVTGMQSVAVATVIGLVVAVALLALGTLPDHAVLTIAGCIGLLVNVPWAISHFFPGEGRAPLLIAVSGVLIVLVAVWLAHQGGELKHQFRHHRRASA